jgi:hypothetical protein
MAALRRAEINLENEYARSEALVTTMMPPSIATRLKVMPDQRIADRIECAFDSLCERFGTDRLKSAELTALGRR